jgi:hypothetical protein
VLADAAGRAGLPEVGFVAEPVAAAAYFASVLGRRIPQGHCLVVYDLGAGTFDISVIRPYTERFEVVAAAGLDDVGGLDLDAAVVGHARGLTAGVAWARLDWPQTPADRQARYSPWRNARAGKEQLSRHTATDLHIPLVDTEVHLTREEFEKAARPYLDRTASLTLTVLHEAGIPREKIGGVFLVGGSSRIPLAATVLHRTVGIAPTALDHPELVVAEGSMHTRPTPAVPAPEPARDDIATQPAYTGQAAVQPIPKPPPTPVTATGAALASPASPGAETIDDDLDDTGGASFAPTGTNSPRGAVAAPAAEPISTPTGVDHYALPGTRTDPRLMVAGQLAILGAAALVVGLFPAYMYTASLWQGRSDAADMRWYALYLLTIAPLTVGAGACTLIPGTRRLIGPGLLLGITAASTWGLVFLASDRLRYKDVPGIFGDGWWVELVAHLVLLLVACLAGLALVRTARAGRRDSPVRPYRAKRPGPAHDTRMIDQSGAIGHQRTTLNAARSTLVLSSHPPAWHRSAR